MKPTPLIKEGIIHAPAADVWKAITDKDEMKRWYFDLEEFKPETGFEFSFYGEGSKGEKYLHLCRITEVIPGKKLSHSWRYEGIPGISYLTFELFNEGDNTRLVLTHDGLETFATDSPDFKKESFSAGWNEILNTNLKNYLESKKNSN